MKIFLASVDVYDELLKVSDNDHKLNILFSFYDLTVSTIPFRKEVWKRIMKEKINK